MKRMAWFVSMFFLFNGLAYADPPNRFDVVQQVWNTGLYTITTEEGACEFTNAVVIALHRIDPLWGHILKTQPSGGCYGGAKAHAFDAVLYLGTRSTIDIIFQQGVSTAKIQWFINHDDVPEEKWWVPFEAHEPDPSSDLVERVAELEKWLTYFQSYALEREKIADSLSERVGNLSNRIEILANETTDRVLALGERVRQLESTTVPVECRASVFGVPISCHLITR